MTVYRIVILGRTPTNAAKLDKALRGLVGLQSLYLNDNETMCFLYIESSLDKRAFIAWVEGALAGTGCTVQLLGVDSDLKEVKTHFLVATYPTNPDVDINYEFNKILEERFGGGYELSCPAIKDMDDLDNVPSFPGVLVLAIQSARKTGALMDELEALTQHLHLQFDELLDQSKPKVDPKVKATPAKAKKLKP